MESVFLAISSGNFKVRAVSVQDTAPTLGMCIPTDESERTKVDVR